MKKWVGPIVSLFLIGLLILIYGPFNISKPTNTEKMREGKSRIVLAQEQRKEKKGEPDSNYISILKKIQVQLDEWTKSLDDRIEREDITRLEVRFLEISRNILQWVKEKIDAKIESSTGKKPEQRKRRGLFLETHQRVSPFPEIG